MFEYKPQDGPVGFSEEIALWDLGFRGFGFRGLGV